MCVYMYVVCSIALGDNCQGGPWLPELISITLPTASSTSATTATTDADASVKDTAGQCMQIH
jgi:hypothetical protein